MISPWPATELDPVRRLRVLAAGLGAAMYAEDHIDAPFAEVWSMASDLAHELPHLVPTIKEFHVRGGLTDRSMAWAYGPLGHRAQFEVLLQPGWCVMQSACVVGAMAAVPEGGGTRFAVLGTLRGHVPAPLRMVLARSIGASRGRKMIERARRRTAARRTC